MSNTQWSRQRVIETMKGSGSDTMLLGIRCLGIHPFCCLADGVVKLDHAMKRSQQSAVPSWDERLSCESLARLWIG